MRLTIQAVFMAALLLVPASWAATGRVIKVLPHFKDGQGRITLSPSLFERDAYQAYLRANPDKRSGLRFSVQWKSRKAIFEPLKVQVELRGTAQGNLPKQHVLQKQVEPSRWLSRWTDLDLSSEDYKAFGEVTAWRVTLWEGDRLLAEQKSFLW